MPSTVFLSIVSKSCALFVVVIVQVDDVIPVTKVLKAKAVKLDPHSIHWGRLLLVEHVLHVEGQSTLGVHPVPLSTKPAGHNVTHFSNTGSL